MNKLEKRAYYKSYYAKNKEKILAYRRKKGFTSIQSMHKRRFNGLREQVMELFGHKCFKCGMTREDHKEKWGRDLTLHHIDGNGRYSENPNNSLDNLIPLCLPEHGKIEYESTH